MRYMMLINHDEAEMGKADWSTMAKDYAAFSAAIEKAGINYASGERLMPSTAATTVRVQAGKKSVLDGPYADTKEQFAGYFMIDVPDLDQAIEWAARCPSSAYGSIEIRPMHAGQGS